MRLKELFLVLSLLLISTWGILFVLSLKDDSMLFYIAESIILFGLFFLIFFYRKAIKPLKSIGNGMELLHEQDFSSRLSPVGQREADHIVEVFNMMMNQLKEERLRLREQNHFLDLLISVSPMGVIILDFDGRISSINATALRFLEYSSAGEVTGKTIDRLSSSLAEELISIPKDTTRIVRLSDSTIYRCSRLSFADRGFSHPFILIESLTSEIIKAEKKAYEKVIRMIGHEVNNSVAGITSTLDTVIEALSTMENTEDLREVMHICIERCYRMSHFITNFANVVKIPDPQLQTAELNTRVSACKLFMENICRNRNITLHLSLCPENPIVKIDISLFEQVLVNIIKNSAESIEQNGDIYITTSSSPLSLEIADTGAGISKETEAKIFSPFFSTKPNGQGIGLIFIREVLIKHECTFSLRTYTDGLTRFKICFPAKV